MRKIGIVLGVAVGILVLAMVLVWALADPNRHRDYIQAQFENQLSRKVTLGDMSLGLLPLRFQVKQPVIAEDASLGQQNPFIQADNLDIQVRLFPLLRGDVQIDSIELRRPRVELIRTKQGTWNFATLGPETAGGAATGTLSGQGAERKISLEQLRIVDGQIGLTDLQHNRPRIGYDHIDLTLLHFSPGQPFAFDLAARVQGEAGQELRLKGEGGPVSAANPADTPFHATLSVSSVSVDGLLKFLNVPVITKAAGALSGQSDVASRSGTLSANGMVKLDGARVNGLDIGYPLSLDYRLTARLGEGLFSVESATLRLGSTPLTLTGTLNTAANPPLMDARIRSGDTSITEIARLASAFGVAFAPGASVAGRVSGDVQVKGPMSRPEVTGMITGRELQVSGSGIPQPVQVKAIDLTLTPTTIRSNEFTAATGKTAVFGQFALLQYASNAPSIELGLKSPGATLPEIQSIAKAYGINGLNQVSGDGSLNFDLRAKAPLQSLTTAAAAKALNGVINLNFSPLKIAGFDTAHELGIIGGFASSLVEHSWTDIVRVTGRINVKEGIAQTNDLQAQLGIGNLAAIGTADLAAESLNLRLSAVFTKEFTDKAAATRTGRLVNVALTNTAGELVLPAIVTGNFRRPKFSPDLKAVAALQRQKYLPSFSNPAAAVGNVLEALRGKKQTSDATTPAEEKTEKTSVVKGILGVLGGQKKDPPGK